MFISPEDKERIERSKREENRRRGRLQYPKMLYREEDKTCTVAANQADEKLLSGYQQEPWPEVTEVAPKAIPFGIALDREKQRQKREAAKAKQASAE